MFSVRHIPSIRVAVLCLLSALILVAGLGAQHHLACAASRVSQEKNWQIAAMLDPESGGAGGLAVRALAPDRRRNLAHVPAKWKPVRQGEPLFARANRRR